MPVIERKTVIQGGHEPRYEQVVSLTSAEILALHTTPITLVPAPKSNYAIVLEGVMVKLDYGTTAYGGIATGDDLTLRYTNGTGATLVTVESTGLFDQTADTVHWYFPPTTVGLVPAPAAPLVASLGGAITGGDSPLRLKLYYCTKDTGF